MPGQSDISPLGEDTSDPLICERCARTVYALVQVTHISGKQWWCNDCQIEVRDREGK